MNRIDLQPIPNQTLSCNLGGQLFDITVQLSRSNGTLLTVVVAGNSIITGRLAVANTAMILIPDSLQYGNMGWICEDGASYPEYEKFGVTHFLYWWKD